MPFTCLHAYTTPTSEGYPAYVSLNRDDKSGECSLTVRSRGNGGRDVGMIILTPEQLRRLARGIFATLGDLKD